MLKTRYDGDEETVPRISKSFLESLIKKVKDAGYEPGILYVGRRTAMEILYFDRLEIGGLAAAHDILLHIPETVSMFEVCGLKVFVLTHLVEYFDLNYHRPDV